MNDNKNNEGKSKIPRESGDDSEDDSEILEESPCGRWLKRREEVQQRDIPGIDAAYLAMDTEEGVEVVWNEVQFSERKNFKLQEDKIRQVFDHLTQLDHPNIVKFHKYWIDNTTEKPRVIFITEYMSSGSLKQFLKKTKRNVIKLPIQAWKRWCTQILSALSYLHTCSPPVVHGNLTCDTIFIQHNGLVKIGSVAPDAINRHVKTFRDDLLNVHFIAPEFGTQNFNRVTPAVDIYSFGMCALEIAALEIPGNGESGTQVTEDVVKRTLDSLENNQQKDFICKCLGLDPFSRPTARQLLFHPVIFEVHSLKLLAAHVIVHSTSYQPEQLTDEAFQSRCDENLLVAEVVHPDGRTGVCLLRKEAPTLELEKFLEDVRNGIYPLTSFACSQSASPSSAWARAVSPELTGLENVDPSTSPEPTDQETRRIIDMVCNIKQHEENQSSLVFLRFGVGCLQGLIVLQAAGIKADKLHRATYFKDFVTWMTLLLRMDDKMNRQLTCEIITHDTAKVLSEELVFYGFINQNDCDMVTSLITDTLSRSPPIVGQAVS